MALTADRLVVIGRGRLIAETSVADFVARSGGGAVKLVTPIWPRSRQRSPRPGPRSATATAAR